MFFDFLSSAAPVFAEEERDFAELCGELRTDSEFVGFMPAVRLDLWPIYALGCTHASRFTGSHAAPKIYLMPIAVSDCAIYNSITETVRDFYTSFDSKDKNKEEKQGFFARLFGKNKPEEQETPDSMLCGIKIEEVMPLRSPALRSGHPLRLSRDCECDVLYFRLVLPNGNVAYLFAVCDTPENVWKKVIEKYEVRCEMIIHSHKGFGHWFTSTPLYEYLTVTKKPHLLPRFYFRGRFITTDDSPAGSLESEIIEDDFIESESAVYRLPDKL
jgi:hypothetical protein